VKSGPGLGVIGVWQRLWAGQSGRHGASGSFAADPRGTCRSRNRQRRSV